MKNKKMKIVIYGGIFDVESMEILLALIPKRKKSLVDGLSGRGLWMAKHFINTARDYDEARAMIKGM